jgi:hypothetical protein
VAAGSARAAGRSCGSFDAAEEVAIVARAKRDVLLRAHRFRLRREDLEDCYSQATLELVAHVRSGGAFADLYRSGIRAIEEIVKDNPLAQDYMHWGEPGPGRWVTIYSATSPSDHAFMTIAGLRLDTSHDGTDVGPNRFEDGPRWRILDRIPSWAHWSVRHPPGL